MARDELVRVSRQDITTRPKNVILITDGSQSSQPDAVSLSVISDEIRKLGVNLFVIGIGNTVRVRELNLIAENPEKVYLASHFNELQSNPLVKRVSEDICKASMLPVSLLVLFLLYKSNCLIGISEIISLNGVSMLLIKP